MNYENREDVLAVRDSIVKVWANFRSSMRPFQDAVDGVKQKMERWIELYEEQSRLEDLEETITNLDRARLRGEAMGDIDFAKHVFEHHNPLDYMIWSADGRSGAFIPESGKRQGERQGERQGRGEE